MRMPVPFALALASACAPESMTPERAERLCAERIGLADGVSGVVEFGAGSDGAHSGASITLTRRIFTPQTEEEFMSECVGNLLEGRSSTTEVSVSAGRIF